MAYYPVKQPRSQGNVQPVSAQTPIPAADWSGEISPLVQEAPPSAGHPPANAGRAMDRLVPAEERSPWPVGRLDLRNGLPAEMITDPVSTEEVYRGSLKAMLLRYVGTYVVATFLVGTQNTVSWEGVLYDVGNDYMTIYQEGRDRYIVSDIYSLKFIEFYDTCCREICDEYLRSGGSAGTQP